MAQPLLMEVCKALGILVLENGGETYRAEEVAVHICRAFGARAEVLALPTGMLLTVTEECGTAQTAVVRVKKRGINLSVIDRVNDLSRRTACGVLTLEQALSEARDLKDRKRTHPAVTALAAAGSVGCFALLFHGTWVDFFIAGICGFLIQYIDFFFRREDKFHFIVGLMGGMLCAVIAVCMKQWFQLGSVDTIISASIMTLVPGLALVNAIRDTMHGDLVSGVARVGEVAIMALSIAAGVGVVLGGSILWGGGI